MAKKGTFKKGNPGGPGRPKGGNLEWCREFAEEEGKKILMKWAKSDNAKVAVQATALIFAYGFGKPTEHHEHSGSVTLEGLLSESCPPVVK